MTQIQQTKQEEIIILAHHNFEKGLNSHAYFKIHDHAVGEDMVQDTFLKTWKYLVNGGKIDTMKAFLYHILNNLIIDQYRKHKTISLDGLIEEGFEPSIDHTERLFNFLDGKKAILLIKRLALIYQKVMHMRYVQDLSLKEISSITGQSKNTIAVQTHRGLGELKSLYNLGVFLRLRSNLLYQKFLTNESPATASLHSATPKKNVPCILDLRATNFF